MDLIYLLWHRLSWYQDICFILHANCAKLFIASTILTLNLQRLLSANNINSLEELALKFLIASDLKIQIAVPALRPGLLLKRHFLVKHPLAFAEMCSYIAAGESRYYGQKAELFRV